CAEQDQKAANRQQQQLDRSDPCSLTWNLNRVVAGHRFCSMPARRRLGSALGGAHGHWGRLGRLLIGNSDAADLAPAKLVRNPVALESGLVVQGQNLGPAARAWVELDLDKVMAVDLAELRQSEFVTHHCCRL